MGFLRFFCTFSHNVAQLKLGLFCTKLCTRHYFVYIIFFKWLEFKIIVIRQKLRVKWRFYAFLRFLCTFAYNVAHTWFVLHETCHITLFGVYYWVDVVRIVNHSHMLEISCSVAILWVFYVSFALSRIKQLKLGLFCTKLCTRHYLACIIVLKWLELKIVVICQKLRVKLRFYGYLNFFGTFAHNVAQTQFVLQETWHITLFDIYQCVEVVRIENHSHMQEIQC